MHKILSQPTVQYGDLGSSSYVVITTHTNFRKII